MKRYAFWTGLAALSFAALCGCLQRPACTPTPALPAIVAECRARYLELDCAHGKNAEQCAAVRVECDRRIDAVPDSEVCQ